MRGRGSISGLTLAALILGAALAPASAAPSATTTIPVGDNFFLHDGHIATVRVARNTTIRWVWTTDTRHDVTVRRGPRKFRSGARDGGSYRTKLSRRGRYTFVCTIHGAADQSIHVRVR